MLELQGACRGGASSEGLTGYMRAKWRAEVLLSVLVWDDGAAARIPLQERVITARDLSSFFLLATGTEDEGQGRERFAAAGGWMTGPKRRARLWERGFL